MAGEQYNVTKVIRNGDEYYFPGAGKIISKKVFGDGSDGNCVIEYDDSVKGNVFMEAKEYNFCNFTVCPKVKLRFCGNGIPILRVKECFLNCGTIWLRNPLMNCDSQYAEPYTHFVLAAEKNPCASCAQRIFDSLSCECLKSAKASGGTGSGYANNTLYMRGAKGGSFYTAAVIESCTCSGCTAYTGNPGTSTDYAAGGGGGGGKICAVSGCSSCNGGDGCPANGYYGGNGGTGIGSAGGGGGGFGLCRGGDGGCGYCGGDGGNSIYGNGGNGGCTTRTSASGFTVGSQGGCSYYGDGGRGGHAQGYLGNGGSGGSSVFGNGGNGGSGCCYADGGWGGNSVFGNGGSGNSGKCGCGMVGSISRGGTYDTGFFAKNLCNAGNICGHGNAPCGGIGSCGARGAKIYMIYQAFSSTGTITCTGNGCTNGALIQCQI